MEYDLSLHCANPRSDEKAILFITYFLTLLFLFSYINVLIFVYIYFFQNLQQTDSETPNIIILGDTDVKTNKTAVRLNDLSFKVKQKYEFIRKSNQKVSIFILRSISLGLPFISIFPEPMADP